MKTMKLFKLSLLVCILISISANVFSQNVPRGRSNDGPALLVAMGRLYLAWSDKDNKRLQVTSSLDGINWAPTVELGETSDKDPALVYFNGRFYLAWRGNDDKHHVNIISSPNGRAWIEKITFQDGNIVARTGDGPALIVANGKLNLMWNNEDHYLGWISSVDGVNWKLAISPANYSGAGLTSPSLSYIHNAIVSCIYVDDLRPELPGKVGGFIFRYYSESDGHWVELNRQYGEKRDGVQVIEAKGRFYAAFPFYKRFALYSSSMDAINWRAEFIFDETSDHIPAIAFYNNLFFIVWTGTDKNHRLNVTSSDDLINWRNKIIFR